MNRFAWLAGSGVLVTWTVAGALGGCGSDEATIEDSNVEAGRSGTSGTGGNPPGDGGDAGAEAGTDADAEAGTDSGGSTPNKVACGARQCSTPAEVCCAAFNDAGCQAPGAECQGDAKRECDEKADCAGGERCCEIGLGAQCRSDCISLQLCKTNAECADGTCYVNKCVAGGARTVSACTKILGCTQ